MRGKTPLVPFLHEWIQESHGRKEYNQSEYYAKKYHQTFEIIACHYNFQNTVHVCTYAPVSWCTVLLVL